MTKEQRDDTANVTMTLLRSRAIVLRRLLLEKGFDVPIERVTTYSDKIHNMINSWIRKHDAWMISTNPADGILPPPYPSHLNHYKVIKK